MTEPTTTRALIARCLWQLHAHGYRLERFVDFGAWRHYWLRNSNQPQNPGVHLSAPRREARP